MINNEKSDHGSGMLSLIKKKSIKKRRQHNVYPLPSKISEVVISSSRPRYNENIIFRSVISDLLTDLNDDFPLLEEKDDIDDNELRHSTALPWKVKKHRRQRRRRARGNDGMSSTDSLLSNTVERQDYFQKLSDEDLVFDDIEEEVEEDIFSTRHYPSKNNAIPLKQYQRRKPEVSEEINESSIMNKESDMRKDYHTSLSASEVGSVKKKKEEEEVQKCTESMKKVMLDKINQATTQLLVKQGSFKFAKDLNVLVKQESFKFEKELNTFVRQDSPLARRQPRRRSLASSAA